VHKEREKNEGLVLPPEGSAQGPCNSEIGCPSKRAALPVGLSRTRYLYNLTKQNKDHQQEEEQTAATYPGTL